MAALFVPAQGAKAGHQQFSVAAGRLGSGDHTASAAWLLDYQTVMTCINDMDMAMVHPQMQVESGTPLRALAGWGA